MLGMLAETIADCTERSHTLLALACPAKEDTPFFNHCMALAKAQGMTWDEGLDYVIRCRREMGR